MIWFSQLRLALFQDKIYLQITGFCFGDSRMQP